MERKEIIAQTEAFAEDYMRKSIDFNQNDFALHCARTDYFMDIIIGYMRANGLIYENDLTEEYVPQDFLYDYVHDMSDSLVCQLNTLREEAIKRNKEL